METRNATKSTRRTKQKERRREEEEARERERRRSIEDVKGRLSVCYISPRFVGTGKP